VQLFKKSKREGVLETLYIVPKAICSKEFHRNLSSTDWIILLTDRHTDGLDHITSSPEGSHTQQQFAIIATLTSTVRVLALTGTS